MSRPGRWGEVLEIGFESGVGLSGDVALEAAHDLALGLALTGAPVGVVAGALAVAQPTDGDQVKRPVGKLLTLRISHRVQWALTAMEDHTLATVTVTWRSVPVGSSWLMAPLARRQLKAQLRRLQDAAIAAQRSVESRAREHGPA